jgi:tetratricopeptide (TPR) repeat protein
MKLKPYHKNLCLQFVKTISIFLRQNFFAMKPFFLLAVPALFCAAAINAKFNHAKDVSPETKQDIIALKLKTSINCRPDLSTINFKDNPVPLLEGWGNYRMKVTVKNDSANIYFQQGINFYYSFHIIEALASFDKAVGFDEKFAMGHWGKALAYGPNINDLGYTASPDALESVRKAETWCAPCTPLEQALIAAMKTRYSDDSTQTREHLDKLYAAAMKNVSVKFPNSADAAALFADALMVQHPWDLYDRNYQPKPWTPEIVNVLEKLIKRFPSNPGAAHYYIHAVEGSTHPEKALAVANRLGPMMPGVSHLVHMPSHIYIRSGHYDKGIDANKKAVNGYNSYLSQYAPVSGANFLYLLHNQHMQAACALMDGQYQNALTYSRELSGNIDPSFVDATDFFGVMAQYLDMTPTFVQVRFGKWDEILRSPVIPETRVYANILWHFAKGIALAKTKKQADAEKELAAIQNAMPNKQLQESPPAFNPGIAGVKVAEKILQGVIAEANNDLPKAIDFFTQAVDNETAMLYNEPRDWQLPARHYLGNALLTANKYSEAEKVFWKDLQVNPNNAWALTGLLAAQQKMRKIKEAAITKVRLKKASERMDIKITSSAF